MNQFNSKTTTEKTTLVLAEKEKKEKKEKREKKEKKKQALTSGRPATQQLNAVTKKADVDSRSVDRYLASDGEKLNTSETQFYRKEKSEYSYHAYTMHKSSSSSTPNMYSYESKRRYSTKMATVHSSMEPFSGETSNASWTKRVSSLDRSFSRALKEH